MRGEFSVFKVKLRTAQGNLHFALQMRKTGLVFNARPQGAGFSVAKRTNPREPHIKGWSVDMRERFHRSVHSMPVNLADKSEREMEIFNRAPARAFNAVLKRRQGVGDTIGNAKSDKQAGHAPFDRSIPWRLSTGAADGSDR